jgi:Do/DeqQ family serine protease
MFNVLKPRNAMKTIFRFLFAAFLGGLSSLYLYTEFIEPRDGDSGQPGAVPIVFTKGSAVTPNVPLESIDFVKASKLTVDAVVHVKTTFQAQRYYNPWSQFFGGDPYYSQEQKATGSGVIISGDGYIVTNNHVIENAAKIEVTTNNNRTYVAELVGSDPATDLALLKIKETGMPAITLGDSDNLQIGEWVLAVGNPFNLTSTVTAGIVSAKARNINILNYNPSDGVFPLESFIQTDAAVNPGNSGGALVNGLGELVGINTAIASRTGSYSGYSFAIPVSIVQKVIADIVEFGAVQRAYIGVNIANIDEEIMKTYKIEGSEGAFVRGLMTEGAAAQAGLKEGDVIIGVEGIEVRNVTQLQEQVGKFRPGDKINVTVRRDNANKNFEVTLRDRFGNTAIQRKSEIETSNILGMGVTGLSEGEKQSLKVKNGVKVTAITDPRLRKVGLKEGFIITHIDKRPVASVEDLNQALKGKRGGILIEGVHPNGTPDYYGLGI